MSLLEQMAKRHEQSESAPEGVERVCLTCWQPWPCDASLLIPIARAAQDVTTASIPGDGFTALREALRTLEAKP